MSVSENAMFAAGCFWGVEHSFAQIEGVTGTAVGYAGGHVQAPDYERVCGGGTGHAEVVHLQFDPERISYDRLLRCFFEMHDPTQLNRQGPDRGSQYRSAIYCFDADQLQVAERVKRELNDGEYDGRIVTEVARAPRFWPAEAYHQQYMARNGAQACAR